MFSGIFTLSRRFHPVRVFYERDFALARDRLSTRHGQSELLALMETESQSKLLFSHPLKLDDFQKMSPRCVQKGNKQSRREINKENRADS
jgi:hypothetical protein